MVNLVLFTVDTDEEVEVGVGAVVGGGGGEDVFGGVANFGGVTDIGGVDAFGGVVDFGGVGGFGGCGGAVGLIINGGVVVVSAGDVGSDHFSFFSFPTPMESERESIGKGNTMVELCSVEMALSVWR